jgi:hypothetical protein
MPPNKNQKMRLQTRITGRPSLSIGATSFHGSFKSGSFIFNNEDLNFTSKDKMNDIGKWEKI